MEDFFKGTKPDEVLELMRIGAISPEAIERVLPKYGLNRVRYAIRESYLADVDSMSKFPDIYEKILGRDLKKDVEGRQNTIPLIDAGLPFKLVGFDYVVPGDASNCSISE